MELLNVPLNKLIFNICRRYAACNLYLNYFSSTKLSPLRGYKRCVAPKVW